MSELCASPAQKYLVERCCGLRMDGAWAELGWLRVQLEMHSQSSSYQPIIGRMGVWQTEAYWQSVSGPTQGYY